MADFQEPSDDHKNKKANDQQSNQQKNQDQTQKNDNALDKDLSDAPQKDRYTLIKRYFGAIEMDISDVSDPHLKAIYLELNWWLQIVWCRYKDQEGKRDFKKFMGGQDFKSNPIIIPDLPQESNYYQWLESFDLVEKKSERLLLATVMALSLNDALFLSFLEMLKHPMVTIFVGGQVKNNGRRFIPTMQTLFYLLGGVDLKKHTTYQRYFRTQQSQITNWGLEMISSQTRITGYSGATDEWKNLLISLQPNIWQYFLGGAMPKPEDNQDLPI